jgi:short-subunit dehydrogenase
MTATVLITGASQGIGRATAEKFAKQGYNIVLAARQSDRLAAAATDIRAAFDVETLAVSTDVKDPEQVDSLIQKALTHFDTIDVLVNNAGIYISGPVEAFSLEDWHQAIDTNLWGYVHTIHAILPHFIQRQQGTIVNVCSIGGKMPIPYLTPYTTSKYAVTGLTQALQAELVHKGIQVSGIYPNIIKTNFLERAIFRGHGDKETHDRRAQVESVLGVPMVEKPEDVAQAIWDAVEHKRAEIVVGSAKLSAGLHQLLPQVMEWMTKKVFQHKD